uniref:Uncharacterized protein n=1 Tax=Arundo donax TaxID=35708 RepID=A0A0A8Y760_ARUDO
MVNCTLLSKLGENCKTTKLEWS